MNQVTQSDKLIPNVPVYMVFPITPKVYDVNHQAFTSLFHAMGHLKSVNAGAEKPNYDIVRVQ